MTRTEISINSSVFNILDNLKVNDYLTIDSEKVKVTGFDGENNTLSILREQLSTTGSSHVSGSDVILDAYSNTPSYLVGLNVTESEITASDDTSLADNAAGTSNASAPGANRYKISAVSQNRVR